MFYVEYQRWPLQLADQRASESFSALATHYSLPALLQGGGGAQGKVHQDTAALLYSFTLPHAPDMEDLVFTLYICLT